jgi:hypothetical protein
MLKLFSNFQWFKFNFENRKHSKTRLKRILNLFSKPQIRITHMIRHWKAIEIAQLCYLCKCFQIPHAFWIFLKILEFRSIQKWADYNLSRFSKPFVGIMQIIWHWIDMEHMQLFHVLSFSNSAQFLNNFKNNKFGDIQKRCKVIWFEFLNRLSEWCKWYTIGKLWKMRNCCVPHTFASFLQLKNNLYDFNVLWFVLFVS